MIPDLEERKRINKELCEKYPFLQPINWRTGKPYEDDDYSFTWLDRLPDGWRIAFGEQMCQELTEALEEDGALENYMISDIKEKYGYLHWIDDGGTEKTDEIVKKYEDISERTCAGCGAPAVLYSKPWVAPWCKDCAEALNLETKCETAEEYFG